MDSWVNMASKGGGLMYTGVVGVAVSPKWAFYTGVYFFTT